MDRSLTAFSGETILLCTLTNYQEVSGVKLKPKTHEQNVSRSLREQNVCFTVGVNTIQYSKIVTTCSQLSGFPKSRTNGIYT